MPEPHELPWNPLTPPEVARLFAGWGRFWCIAGGWAIDLNIGHISREHGDVDVVVLRHDLDAIHTQLPGWELWVAWPPGTLIPWRKDETIHEKAHDIWCREAGATEWRFQMMVMDHDDEHWIFRRDWSVGGPLASLAREVESMPVLAPEIQLLYKGTSKVRPKDEADFRTALPYLTPVQRAWLHGALASRVPDHPWLAALSPQSSHGSPGPSRGFG